MVYTLYFIEPEKSGLQGKTTAVLLYYQMRIIESGYIRNMIRQEGFYLDSTVQTVQEVGNQVSQYKQMFENYLPDITKFGIKVVLAIVAFWVGSTVIKWIVKFVRKSLTKSRLDTGVAQFMSSLVKIILYILLIFNISTSFGVKESSLAALLGTAGVTMGLALQGGLANLAGGMMLLLFKPFQVGDYIIVNGQDGSEGTVAKVEICYTTLLSIDNKHIVIPNGTLSNTAITNVTARDQRRLEIKVGISYNADIQKAKDILEDILTEDPDTREDEEMVVFVDELAESSVIMGFRVWVDTDRYWETRWRLNQRIKEDFDYYGIEIPYNQLDVHLHK